MKLSQLIESFVISNDEFEDYLNRATEQLTQELQTGKNPRDAVHDLALTFADQHNKSYDAYTRMSDSLSARMHTLELDGSTSTEIAPADMMNGPEMSDMGAEPEMMTDPMGDMDMDVPAEDEMPGDSDMEDYAAVMDNEPEVEESMNEALETETVKTKVGERPRGPGWTLKRSGEQRNEPTDTWERKFKRVGKPTGLGESDDDEKARQRAFAKADEPERGEKPKKVSLKKAPWEESVNEGDDTVKVVFRKFDNGDVIALFPEEEQGRGLITSYMEIGQHGDASKSLITDLEPASKEEYAELAAELKRIGYDIVMAESVNEAKASVLDQLQSIVDDQQAKSIKFDDGSAKVDMFTASAITQVYDKVNDDNKAKIEKMLNTRTGLMKIAKVAMGSLREELETDGRNRGGADLKPSQIQKLDKTGKNPTMRRYVNKKLAVDAKMNKANDPAGEKKGLGPAVVDKKKAQDKADKRKTNEAEDTTEYGIVRYPDTAISYIKRTENGWEHIFDKSYGFEGPVDKADLQYAKKIKTEKVPARLREVAPAIAAVARGVVGAAKVANKVGTAKAVKDRFSSESVEERASRIVSGAFAEAAKPDFADIDGDGDKKEPMKKAAKDKKSGKKGMTDKQKKYFGKK